MKLVASPVKPTKSLGQINNLAILRVSKNKPLVDRDEETRKSTPTFGTVSLVSALWSLFEVATDVLLFMQSKTTETTSGVQCDPHSADLKVLLTAKFNRGQKYTKGTTVSSRLLTLCSQSIKNTEHLKVSHPTGNRQLSF